MVRQGTGDLEFRLSNLEQSYGSAQKFASSFTIWRIAIFQCGEMITEGDMSVGTDGMLTSAYQYFTAPCFSGVRFGGLAACSQSTARDPGSFPGFGALSSSLVALLSDVCGIWLNLCEQSLYQWSA